LRGQGDSVTRTRPVGYYDAVSAGGEFEIYLTQGPTEDIKLEGQANVLTELSTQVKNNKLIIKYEKNRIKINKPVKIYLTTPKLSGISVSGSNTVRGVTDWQVTDLNLDATGSSNIHLNVKGAHHIDTHTSGSVDMVLNGDATSHDLDISGSGNIKAFGLITKEADIKVSGSGKCEVSVTNRLQAKISGSGKVRYKGSPVVSTNISGSGSVSQVE
jgi:hypothetical protein